MHVRDGAGDPEPALQSTHQHAATRGNRNVGLHTDVSMATDRLFPLVSKDVSSRKDSIKTHR